MCDCPFPPHKAALSCLHHERTLRSTLHQSWEGQADNAPGRARHSTPGISDATSQPPGNRIRYN